MDVAGWLLGAAAGSFGLLAAVLGWMGQRVAGKLDAIADALNKTDKEWRQEQAALALRVALIEAHCNQCRGKP